jgi:hypothetical protein
VCLDTWPTLTTIEAHKDITHMIFWKSVKYETLGLEHPNMGHIVIWC